MQLNVVVHTFDPSTQMVEAGESASSRVARAAQHSETTSLTLYIPKKKKEQGNTDT